MKKVVLAPAVEIALRTLDPDGVRRVDAWIDHLKNWDNDETVRRNSRPLKGMPGVYILLTTTEIRIFFEIEDDTVTVLDIANRAAILASGGNPGLN